jgi:hypothetical protein
MICGPWRLEAPGKSLDYKQVPEPAVRAGPVRVRAALCTSVVHSRTARLEQSRKTSRAAPSSCAGHNSVRARDLSRSATLCERGVDLVIGDEHAPLAECRRSMHERLRTRAWRVEREPEAPQPTRCRPRRRVLAISHGKVFGKPAKSTSTRFHFRRGPAGRIRHSRTRRSWKTGCTTPAIGGGDRPKCACDDMPSCKR